MELLAKMFRSKKEALLPVTGSCAADQELRVAKLTDWNDIEAYLITFECLMSAYSVAKDGRIFKLVPQVSGRTQQAMGC